MKRIVSVLLFILMVLSLAGCMSVRVPVISSSGQKPAAQSQTVSGQAVSTATEAPADAPAVANAEPTAEPTAKPTPEPTAEPTPEPTPEPTAEPTPDPEAGTFAAAAATAVRKLSEVKSLRMEMALNAMGMPLLSFGMDLMEDPFLAKMDIALSAAGEQAALRLYAAAEGEDTVLYISYDDGLTWEKQVSEGQLQLPQAPADTLGLFAGAGDIDMTLAGTQEIDGRTAQVFTGEIDGDALKDVLYSTGIIGALGSALGTEVPEAALLELGSAATTFAFDAETGLPLRYTIDMTEVLTNLLEALMGDETGSDIAMSIPTVTLEISLSQFDSIETIEIPEAALNAPEA